ncbi:MAG: hypothetical protein LUE98_05285 [Tannerellaceae bacterium]|nr:hypothetical protein [Tannerellaceae bacterium]
MNTKNLFPKSLLIPWVLLLITSCQQEVILNDIQDEYKEGIVQTRALSYEYASVSNPDLHNNWETVDKIILNGGGLQIDPPWKMVAGNSMDIPDEFRMDIKRTDGWEMLSHTLINSNSDEPNYILFYNKLRGILKGFYYHPVAVGNNSFVWLLESKTPSSILPSNKRTQGIFNSTGKYATTSNVIKQSNANFGHLNKGWNGFSFELVYGNINNKPTIDIKGFNNLESQIKLNGTYTGQVLVPNIEKSDPAGGFDKILKGLGGVVGFVGNFFPPVKSIGRGISVAGSAIGSASGYFSSENTVYTTLNTSGQIELDGTSITNLGGSVPPLSNVPLQTIVNKNESLGLWSLKQQPEYSYNQYLILNRIEQGYFVTYPTFTPQTPIESLIVVNPTLPIKSFKVINIDLIALSKPSFCTSIEVTKDCYFVNSQTYVRGNDPYRESKSDVVYFYPAYSIPSKTIINITVEFDYGNDKKVVSSRSFDMGWTKIQNSSILNEYINQGKTTVPIYGYLAN